MTTGREIIRVNPQGIGVKRVALQDSAEKLKLEIKLALLTEPSCRRFRSLPFRGRLAWSIVGCGHRGDAPFPALYSETRAILGLLA